MSDIIELFGLGFLSATVSLGMIKIYRILLEAGGVLHMVVNLFMKGICG